VSLRIVVYRGESKPTRHPWSWFARSHDGTLHVESDLDFPTAEDAKANVRAFAAAIGELARQAPYAEGMITVRLE